MNTYPKREITFRKMFQLSFRQHFSTMYYGFFCIALLFLIAFMHAHFLQNVHDHSFAPVTILGFKVIYVLFFIFFFSVALLNTHQAFSGQGYHYTDAFRKICLRMPRLLLILGIYIGGMCLLIYLLRGLHTAIFYLDKQADSAVEFVVDFFSLIVFLLFICIFFFSFPLAVIKHDSLSTTFKESMLLSEKNKTGIILLLFFITMTYSLLLSQGQDISFVARHQLGYLYDFLVLCVMVPLCMNFLLLLINDAKQQIKIDQE